MEHSISQVHNVLRNYQGILGKKKVYPPTDKPISQQNTRADRINISKEALKMLDELKASRKIEQTPPESNQTAGENNSEVANLI